MNEENVEAGDSEAPVVFISYSWTTPAHEEFVLDIATELRQVHRLDVRLDKWHLPTGGDANLFMERGIRDANKVLIISDCEYARKANNRKGGAGTEAQILTPELYAQEGGDGAPQKFAVVVTEYGEDEKPCKPTFYGGRIFIEMTDPTRRSEKMEEIARWAHDRPLHVAPEIGGSPAYLDDRPSTGTAGPRSRALSALAAHRPDSARAAEDYFDRFSQGLAAFIPPAPQGNSAQLTYGEVAPAIEQASRGLCDALTELEGVLIELARARLGERGHDALRRFVASLYPYVEGTPNGHQVAPWQTDPFDYFIPHAIRTAAAALIQVNDFDGFFAVTGIPYTKPGRSGTHGVHEAIDLAHFQQGLDVRGVADPLFKIYGGRNSKFTQDELVQADLLLYFSSVVEESRDRAPVWWPEMLAMWRYNVRVLPTFALAESRSHLERVARAFKTDAQGLLALIDRFLALDAGERNNRAIPRVDFARLTGRERLGTRP